MGATHHLRKLGPALCLITGLAAFGSGFAQDGSVEIGNAVYQEVQVEQADGTTSTSLQPVSKVVPGDEVVYEITYRNGGEQIATDVIVSNPVSADLVFVGSSVPPTAVSVDGGATFGPLAELQVLDAEGNPRAALPSDITTLRWVIATLRPGETGSVSFRATVK